MTALGETEQQPQPNERDMNSTGGEESVLLPHTGRDAGASHPASSRQVVPAFAHQRADVTHSGRRGFELDRLFIPESSRDVSGSGQGATEA